MKDGFVIEKSTKQISSEDLELINKLTRRKFSNDEIYTFSVLLCDNEIDRDYERFTDKSLKKLESMFVGKTGILDHEPKSENQTARIYKCYTEKIQGKLNSLGEPYKRLIAKAYMPKCEKNENIILQIDSGIKKEVSVGCMIEKSICSICLKDIKSDLCSHIKGKKYKDKLCYANLENPLDAYEWSFVAVPAQRMAGVIKSYMKGGENNMVEKNSNTFDNIENQELKKTLEDLKQKAKIGQMYYDDLKKEVIKLSAMVQPQLSSKVMESICQKASIEELKSLKTAFKTQFSQMMPSSPQLSHVEKENQKTKNLQFKI